MTQEFIQQHWLDAILTIARHYRIETSEENLKLKLQWSKFNNTQELITLLSKQVGLDFQQSKFSIKK